MALTNTGSLQLQAGQVDVWLASLSNVSSSEAFAYLQLLSEPEQAQWQRFKVEDARLQYLVTRALVRTTLSRYADVPARTWQFETNAYGCPHISLPQASRNLRFNLSNTTGLVACAVSMDCEIGIDVENITRTVDADAVAPSVFAPAELADFREAGLEDQRERFFSYWTLKESYIKARGMGLSLPLEQFSFDLDARPIGISFGSGIVDDPSAWQFALYRPSNDHMMAAGIKRGAGRADLKI